MTARVVKLGDWLASFAVQAVAQHVGACTGYHVLIVLEMSATCARFGSKIWKDVHVRSFFAFASQQVNMYAVSEMSANILADMLADFACSV